MIGGAAAGLQALEERLRQDLAWLELPARPWVIARDHGGAAMADVVIIGAGMAGLALSAALRFLGIQPVVYDRSPEGFEGPWATTARMETLRSPKQLTGPALGLPALTFQAWFQAQFGLEQWQALDKIPRLQWMDYLRWYRRVLNLPIHNEHEVEAVVPRAADRVELVVRHGARRFTLQARHVVLATGRDGIGAAWSPQFARDIPAHRRAHSSDVLDFKRLAGQRVAVVGAGSSAMDVAATALEAGAARVDLLSRRADLPRINKGKGAGSPGMTYGYHQLPDEWKWRLRHYLNLSQTPPPRGSTLRVSRHANAHFHVSCPVEGAREEAGAVRLITAKGALDVDFVFFATGFRVDFEQRPEFASFAADVRRWGDRYQGPEGQADEELAESPDLGSNFEFQSRSGADNGLSRIHCFCYPAVLSHGAVSGDIPAISEGAQRLAQGLASELFREGIEGHFAAMKAYSDPELLGDEWRAAQWGSVK